MSDKTFLRITNKMIYDEIQSIGKKLGKHSGILLWHNWAIGIIIVLLGAIISGLLSR